MVWRRARILEQLPDNVALNFINLFDVEIVDRLSSSVKHWYIFDAILGHNVVESYMKQSNDKVPDAVELFYQKLTSVGKIKELYTKLLEYFDIVDKELYSIFSIDEWEKESSDKFLKFLNVLDVLLPHFDLQMVVDYLGQYSFVLRTEYKSVLDRWKKGDISERYAKSLIIRTICIMYDSSTYHLMYAILRCGDEAKKAVEKVFPEFELYYVRNIFEDRDGIFHVIDCFDNLGDAIKEVMNTDTESKYAVNVLFDYIPRYHIAPLFYRVSKDPPLNLREYQLELAEPALNGKNTVICAPTGSGKTVVAAYIIRDHVIKMRKNSKDPKIAFIVPTGPLVDQQQKLVEHYLRNMLKAKSFRAENQYMSAVELSGAEVFVMTAKMLANISSPEGKEDNPNYFPLSKFTLLILDEAHHADKGHPFNELMDIYRDEKYGSGLVALQKMPQVVSMTASLGTSKTTNLDEIKNHIISMCAQLDAETISRTVKHLDELKRFTSNTMDEVVYVPTNDNSTVTYRSYVWDLSDYLQKAVRRIDGIAGVYEGVLFEKHMEISKIGFIGWATDCYDNILPLLQLSQTAMIEARYCFEVLKKLHWTLRCVSGFPTDETTKFYLGGLGKSDGNALERRVFEAVQRIERLPVAESEIFQKLVGIVKEQFEKNPNSRIVIFVMMKAYCILGLNCVKKVAGIDCNYITGANSSLEEFGQTISIQKEVLDNFKSGKTPILFATTVADEGLDIEKCNLVIKYNLVTDEIAHVQRKGRARQLQSRCFLLTGDEKLFEQEEKNKELVEMMEKAHDELNTLTEAQIEMMIRKGIEKTNQERLLKEKKKKDLIDKMAPFFDKFQLLCRNCTALVTNSESVKRFNTQYVIADPDIWKTVRFVELSEKEKEVFTRRGFIGDINCSCNSKLGKILTWKGMCIPIVSCKKITFVEKGDHTKREVFKRWDQVLDKLFYPQEFKEYRQMMIAEGQPTVLLTKNHDSDVDMDSD